MENKTSNLIKGRKKLSYLTTDEGLALPKIERVFSICDIDEYLDCTPKTKLDCGRQLPESTADAETAEEDAPEEECVALPTEETNPAQDGILDKESPFKDSAPLKTSSPILVATDVHEAGDEEEPMGLPLLLADDNEDPIKGNVDQPLSTQEEDVAKEASLVKSPTLTPPKRFTLGVKAQQESLSPVIDPPTRRNHVIPVEKNLPGASENHTLAEDKTARPPVAVRDPSSQKLDDNDDDDDDDFFLVYDTPLLFSLKRKTESQTSHAKKPSKKAEAKSGTRAKDGVSSTPESEPGAEGDAAGQAPPLEPPPKSPAGVASPSEHPPKSPARGKRAKQGKQIRRRAGVGEAAAADTPAAGGDPAEAAPKETLLKGRRAQKKRDRRSKRTEMKAGAKERASADPGSRPATATSKPQPPTADGDDEDDNGGDYGDGLVPQSPVEGPQETSESVKPKTRKVASSRPFSSKHTKKRKLHRQSSELYSVTDPPDCELTSELAVSKATPITTTSTTRPANSAKAANAAPSPCSPEDKRMKKQGHTPQKRKRQEVVRPEEGEEEKGAEEGDGEPDATGETVLSESSSLGKRRRNKPGTWWAVNLEKQDDDDEALSTSPPKSRRKSRKEDGKKPRKTGTPGKGRRQTSLESLQQDSAESTQQQHVDGAKAPSKPRQRKVKGDGSPDKKKPQTGKGGQRRPQEEATSPLPNQSEEEEVVVGVARVAELQVNMSPAAPTEPAHTSRGGETASQADAPQPGRRQRKPPSNWWEGQQQQAQQEDIIPSPSPSLSLSSPPHPLPEPRLRDPTPGVPARGSRSKRQRSAKPGGGSLKRHNHLRKNLLTQRGGTPKTFKGSLAAFEAIYTSGKHNRTAATLSQVRKNLMNSLEDSSSRSHDHTSVDGNSPDLLNCEDANREVCNQVSTSVGLHEVMGLKGGVVSASNWPSQNHSVPGLKSGPSSMVEHHSYEEAEENQTLPSSLGMPLALSEGDICGPLLKPLTLVPGDWQNLTYWLRQVWRTSVKLTGQVITADHFHWYTHEGRALGHRFDLVCSSYANGKLLLGSYMRKPAQVDHYTTTIFNLYTSSVRVQINDLKSDYHPGQAFVVPRGQSYSIRNLTPVPAILWYHRMFADITEDS